MARLCASFNQARFAVYCGAGIYVHGVSLSGSVKTISTGSITGALSAPRSVAIGVLHAARDHGLNAWLVKHPASTVGRRDAVGVA